MCVRACVRVRVCVCVCVSVRGIQYYDYLILLFMRLGCIH